MKPREINITLQTERFSHQDACRIYQVALKAPDAGTIVIDLSRATDATTSAFARLILLRRALLKCGSDLRLAGLRGRAALLYEINRLAHVLPQSEATAALR